MAQRSQPPPDPTTDPLGLLQLVMDNIPQFIFWKNRDSVFLGCNHNFARIAGVAEPDQIIGKTDYDLAWRREEADFFREVDRRVMGSGEAEYHIIEPQLQAGGKQAWLDTNKIPLLDSSGRVVGILGTFEDITERKQAEIALTEREFNLRTILDSLAEGVLATDASGRVVRMNPVAEALTGMRLSEAAGLPLSSVYRARSESDGQPRDAFAAARHAREAVATTDLILAAGKDQPRHVVETASPMLDGDDHFHGVVLVVRDVTDERRVEDQLRHAQRMEAVGQLAGGIAHDFNNMLTGVVGAAEVLHADLRHDPARQQLATLILKTSERAAELTSKLLAFSRRGRLQLRPIDVHEAIHDVVAIVRPSVDRNIELVVQCDAQSSVVNGDPSELQTALLNLLLNARDAMPDGGRLEISTENRVLDASACAANTFDLEPGNFVHVGVRDTGIGMQRAVLEHIFEPFFTTKPEGAGTGLGLSAVYGVLVAHHGSIDVHSEHGRGTAFDLLLPALEASAERAPSARSLQAVGRGTVLVVDDEEIIRVTATMQLEDLGYEVLTAADGLEALEVFRENRGRISAVMLDVVMPRMGGKACFEALRDMDPHVPVVMTSGFTRDTVHVQLDEHAVQRFLKKPYRRAELIEAIGEVVGARKSA